MPPAALAVLKRLEEAGPKYPNIIADLNYREDLVPVGDMERYTGKVYYQAGKNDQPGRFRIHFDTVRQGIRSDAPTLKNVEDYVFDGNLFIVAKERIRQQITYQVAPPGEYIDALQLGKGPFPVPFGQKAETVLKFYSVGTRQPTANDPPNTDYLRLLARPEHRDKLDVVAMEMWVSRDPATDGLPLKIMAQDRHGNIKTVVFGEKVATPAQHAKDTFSLPRRDGTWEVRVEPYPKK